MLFFLDEELPKNDKLGLRPLLIDLPVLLFGDKDDLGGEMENKSIFYMKVGGCYL